ETTPATGFDTRQGVLEQDRAIRLSADAARRFHEQGRVGLARQPEPLDVQAIGTGVDVLVEPGRMQDGGAVLAGRCNRRFDACPTQALEQRLSARRRFDPRLQVLPKVPRLALAERTN